MKFRLTCLFAVLLSISTGNAQRLPGNARPERYSLHLTPDIRVASFKGSETIDLVLAQPSTTITLNALELTINSVTAAGQSAVVSFDPAKQQATMTFPRPLTAGRIALGIEYTGLLNDKLRGFYISKSKSRSYAVTQFESTDARRAFPSFDEPALKATFDISLTVAAGETAISNTNILSDTPDGTGKHTLRFATTPKMSTYLVAFLVGDFACSKGKADGVPIRVCSTPDKIKLTPYALSAAEHFLSYYDKYFGIKYPLPKLDLIGIPDFEAGAMENFGAITYRETELLLDEKESTVTSKKRVAAVVAHEMAHQWFGDMVTMQWWDNLWLNEGFATWMESKAVGEWHPDWHLDQDTAVELNNTLDYDAAGTTRAIRATAETPSQISEMFDGIAYGKAGAVIGMLESYLGPELFQRGVHQYLTAHLYGNATAEDFWNTQTTISKRPVDRIMASFIDKAGVPLLTFGDQQSAGYPVRESRFFLGGAKLDQAETNEAEGGWTIPVCVKTSKNPACSLVSGQQQEVAIPASGSPFFANAEGRGYYRTAYSSAQLKAITASVENSLTVPERIGFLGDRWALTRSGRAPVGDYLDLLVAVKYDPSAQVMATALESLASIRNRIASDEDKVKLNGVLLRELGPVWQEYEKSGGGASFDRQQIRAELFQSLGTAGDPNVLARAHRITDELLMGHKIGDEDLVDASVILSAATGDEQFYDRLQLVSQKANDPGLQSEALETLAQFRKPILVVRTLEYAVSSQVRNQDAWVLIAIELSQPQNQDIAWAWVQKNWDRVKSQLTTASGSQLISATGSFCTVRQRDETESFFKTHLVEASERSLTKALDSIDACIRLRATQEPNLHEWLAAHPR